MARTFLACGHHIEAQAVTYSGSLECPWGCGIQEIDTTPLGAGMQVIQDSIPFHWNPAFPEPVTGRGQFKRLQKQHGTSDYTPSPDMKSRLDHFAKKAVHDAHHR